MSIIDDLNTVARKLKERGKRLSDPDFSESLDKLEKSAEAFAKSWSGSWLGYHSRVYYNNFDIPPPGANFSQEWGFKDTYAFKDTIGEWREYNYDDVINAIYQDAGNPDIKMQEKESKELCDYFEEAQSALLSILSNATLDLDNDKFIGDLREKIEKRKLFHTSNFIQALRPSGKMMSRDMAAIEKGVLTPPHFEVLADIYAIRQPFQVCEKMGKEALRAASHLGYQQRRNDSETRIGNNVFIGHGRSKLWKDLKDFIQDRLHLPWDEFNRIPIAGVTNIARLSEMLDNAAVAFLIMTGEDEQDGGKLHARLNVVHEAGLFQGRLGFERAIVLLEDGCEEFSNIQGLGQVRFPKGNIKACFEEIREILEREGILV